MKSPVAEPRVGSEVASPCLQPIEGVDALQRPFAVLAFDWDGTAVMTREEDTRAVRDRIEDLLRLGVSVVVITGTNFQNVDRQLSAPMLGPFKRRLYVCTNRGSEVFGFDDQSRPVLLWKRVATARENRLLTEIVEDVRRIVWQRSRLEIRIVYNRLNRRKLDLIPEPRWANPLKSEIGELLIAVEKRLKEGGIHGGIHEIFDLTRQVARSKGLADARITSDVKHIEVGLTDKGDSIAWALRTLVIPCGIPIEEVLIAGDEFGPIAGFEGSDARMLVPDAQGAVVVSVGREPNGVPPGVIHLGGGPPCFRALLDEQIALHRETGAPTHVDTAASPAEIAPHHSSGSDRSWLLVEEGFDPAREREIESLFTIANGYVGTRGSIHGHRAVAQPGTFIAGVYTRQPQSIPEYVIAPDWDRFNVLVAGDEVQMDHGQTLEQRRVLDLCRGVFEHVWRYRDRAGRITHLRTLRFASLADRHALVEVLLLTPENYSATVTVESEVDATTTNAPVETHLGAARSGAARSGTGPLARPPVIVAESVPDSGGVVVMAASSHLHDRTGLAADVTQEVGDRRALERWTWEATIGEAYRVVKLVAVYTSRDGKDPERMAVDHLARLVARGNDVLWREHTRAWADRWRMADVQIDGDEAAQRAVRFGLYHLIASSNPDDDRVSIAARGLTGESYKGHIFWDTEIYVLPFFVFTHPPSARALVMFRYHTLPGARAKARALGYRGALYPWETTTLGQEATPPVAILPDGEVIRIRTADEEHHISADVAYATWHYWRATGDDDLFRDAGAEIMLETARFWASRARLGDDGRYHILGVIGPDEYHEGVDDNAYTNCLARWNLQRGLETAEWLQQRWPRRWAELAEQLALDGEELEGWRDIARAIYTGFDPRTKLFEQFRGYFDLEDIDLEQFEPRTAPIDVLLGRERVARSQIIKQADVVLLVYLLWDELPAEVRVANFRYYAPRCAHGSSLSPSMHALVAARLGDRERARRYFRQAADIDLANNMGNAAGGVHLGAQGGLWQATVFGAGGVQVRDDGLWFDPALLPGWQRLELPLRWRGRQVAVTVSVAPPSIEVALERGPALVVGLGTGGEPRAVLEPGRRLQASKTGATWTQWTEVAR